MPIPFLRHAAFDDLSAIMTLIEDARQHLKNQQIPQWQDGHPSRITIQADIRRHIGYVLVIGHQIAGYTAILQDPDPNYAIIDGSWNHLRNDHYATLHRVVISSQYRGQHLSGILLSNLITISATLGYRDIRIDTHSSNTTMQHILTNAGFKYRGTITIQRDGSPRLAYQYLF